MSNKLNKPLQKLLFFDYLKNLYDRTKKINFEVNISDFHKLQFFRIVGFVHPQELDFNEILHEFEKEGLLKYQHSGGSFGSVTLFPKFFVKLNETDMQNPIKKNNPPPQQVNNIQNVNGHYNAVAQNSSKSDNRPVERAAKSFWEKTRWLRWVVEILLVIWASIMTYLQFN